MLHYGQLQCYSYGIFRIILPSVHCTLNKVPTPLLHRWINSWAIRAWILHIRTSWDTSGYKLFRYAMGDGPTWNIYRTQWRCFVLEGCVLRYLTLSYGIACLTATGCTKPESWCKIQKRTTLPKERNLFGWLLLNLRQGGTCKWAYRKTCAHMEMSANIKSPASESSFNQEGVRAASEAQSWEKCWVWHKKCDRFVWCVW